MRRALVFTLLLSGPLWARASGFIPGVQVGVADGSDAAAGFIGQYVSSNSVATAAMAASTAYGNVVQIDLTAGDWDVTGSAVTSINGATINVWSVAISTNSGNTTTAHVSGVNELAGRPAVSGADENLGINNYRVSVTATTTVYMKARATYTSGPPLMHGSIRARRVR